MKTYGKKNGFTTVELLTVVAILAILAGAILGAAKYVRTRAYERLAASTISVMVTAIEQYHNDNKEFPFITEWVITQDPEEPFVFYDPGGTRDLVDTIAAKTGVAFVQLTGISGEDAGLKEASIETLYFFLSRSPNSSKILGAVSGNFLTNKNGSNAEIKLNFGSNSEFKTVPMIRVLDPWGNPFRYRYLAGNNFPVIISAGPDRKFSPPYDNDNISSADM